MADELNLPRIALRRTSDGGLDDVVVESVEMFRAEMMSEKTLWLCCYLTNGERITWHVSTAPGSRLPLSFETGEVPDYEDWDASEKPHEQPSMEERSRLVAKVLHNAASQAQGFADWVRFNQSEAEAEDSSGGVGG